MWPPSGRRSKIRGWLRKQERDENILRGRQALEKELNRMSADMSFETVSRLFKYEELDDFLAAIGYGDINSQHIATKILEYERREAERLAPFDYFAFHTGSTGSYGIPSDIDRSPDGLRVQGIEGLLTNLGRCCNPVPGDPILGYVTKGRGVTIHRQSCPNISRTLAQGNGRVIEVSLDIETGAHLSGEDPGERV